MHFKYTTLLAVGMNVYTWNKLLSVLEVDLKYIFNDDCVLKRSASVLFTFMKLFLLRADLFLYMQYMYVNYFKKYFDYDRLAGALFA